MNILQIRKHRLRDNLPTYLNLDMPDAQSSLFILEVIKEQFAAQKHELVRNSNSQASPWTYPIRRSGDIVQPPVF